MKHRPTAEEILSRIKVNYTRIQDTDGNPGTILYLGPVASAKNKDEIYAGVEWDDPTRGKHDGSVICRETQTRVQHFVTRKHKHSNNDHSHNHNNQTAASFIRLSKLDFGISLDLNVLNQRYVQPDADLVAPNEVFPNCFARTTKGFTKPIELLGELKIRSQQQLQDLTAISLRSMGISHLSDASLCCPELVDLGKRFLEVDWGSNLFSDWNEIIAILKLFPNATHISFASNQLQDIVDVNMDSTLKANQFPNIQVLNLNQCDIRSFQTVLTIAKAMPNLRELYLSGNDISDVHDVVNNHGCNKHTSSARFYLLQQNRILQNIHLLDLSNCNLTSWDEQINCFCSLPELQTLILDDNSISCIPIPDTSSNIHTHTNRESLETAHNDSIPSYFPKLTSLQIASNAISSWKSIDAISYQHFPHLTSLRFRNNPLTQSMNTGEARAITIARIGGTQLQYLNMSIISERERIESERRYVRNIARELLLLNYKDNNSNDNQNESKITTDLKQEYLSQHPRFIDLMNQHKESMAGTSPASFSSNGKQQSPTTAQDGTLGNITIQVTIRSVASESCAMKSLSKRLPLSLSIGRLKHLCQRTFHLDTSFQQLQFKNNAKDPFPANIENDNDDTTLAYWGVEDNAEIWMNEVDPDVIKLDQQKSKKEYEQKMWDQERVGDIRNEGMKKQTAVYTEAARNAAAAASSIHSK